MEVTSFCCSHRKREIFQKKRRISSVEIAPLNWGGGALEALPLDVIAALRTRGGAVQARVLTPAVADRGAGRLLSRRAAAPGARHCENELSRGGRGAHWVCSIRGWDSHDYAHGVFCVGYELFVSDSRTGGRHLSCVEGV